LFYFTHYHTPPFPGRYFTRRPKPAETGFFPEGRAVVPWDRAFSISPTRYFTRPPWVGQDRPYSPSAAATAPCSPEYERVTDT